MFLFQVCLSCSGHVVRITFTRIVKEDAGPLGGPGDPQGVHHGSIKQIWSLSQTAARAHGAQRTGGGGQGEYWGGGGQGEYWGGGGQGEYRGGGGQGEDWGGGRIL